MRHRSFLGISMVSALIILVFLPLSGCWYKENCTKLCSQDKDAGQNGVDADADADGDGAADTGTADAGWGNIGNACQVDGDCKGYPDPFCEQKAAGVVPCPNGYCSAHCTTPHTWCAPGILCVGVEGIYTGCLEVCTDNKQCRTSEGYICRDMPYIGNEYPNQTFCLPAVVPTDAGTGS